ncbi:SNF2 family N-terminal domain-containing protein [Trichophaea hybrida]|nr:SNF2 family N-terminal domain-containing protein [Trichophaea hybrida]
MTGGTKGFKTPLLSSTVLPKGDSKAPTPRHDPKAENSLVMPRLSAKAIPVGKKVVDVVVDPYLSQHLRPHQREGVEFLYQCVMGMRPFEGRGSILADEMGLGKTLQTITLLWTLMKQNPIYGDLPVVKKALIVCPVTLINNWRKEFRKWLGNERIGVLVVDSKTNLRDFIAGKTYSVLLQKVHTELKKANIDIVIADEGHRLKTEKNKAARAIRALNTPRRIILSGTPLQNDLHEFFIMVDFVNPSLLESYATFRKEFENPILKSRQPGVSKKDIEKGKGRSDELARITAMFVLRRTADILSAYLPPKKEYVIYCRPTSKQREVYRSILDSSAFNKCLGSPDASLLLITVLKKVCNTPGLLTSEQGKEQSDNVQALLSEVNPRLLASKSASSSGKLRVLNRLLGMLSAHTDEKIVIVSNYTSTLDVLQNLLISLGLSWLRLDGSTPTDKRQSLVDKFNRVDSKVAFAFLLSAKSGGAGINLIGASRLVLFDLDWNPATDAQAMARIHRDGQKRSVMIYRMLTTGCFDEKIFQRQITKQGLADSVMDNKAGSSAFTQKELRDLFSLDENTECQTHDLLACACEGKGYIAESIVPAIVDSDDDEDRLPEFPGLMKASAVSEDIISGKSMKDNTGSGSLGALMEYEHVATRLLQQPKEDNWASDLGEEYREASIEDEVLMKVLVEQGKEDEVSFVFQKSF